MLQVSDSVSNVSSGGSSTTTTPNTPNSSTTSSSSSTAPSSPGSPATSPPAVGNRHNIKRHSFTAVNTGHHAHPHHRHSAEILSPPIDSAPNNANNSGGNESFSSLQVRKSHFFLIISVRIATYANCYLDCIILFRFCILTFLLSFSPS